MQFVLLEADRIEAEWPVIAEAIWPAVRQDSHYTLEVMRVRLVKQMDWLFELSGEAQGFMVLELAGDLSCWVKCAAGRVDGGPKARVKTIREIMDFLEGVARSAGCTSLKLCGRDWSRILPNYEPFDGFRNGILKRL